MISRRIAPGHLAAGALLLAGTGMRLWQYLGNASLWVDEIKLARNIAERPLPLLVTAPLDWHQVAPPGFLALVRLLVDRFGPDERVLRLVPLVAALLALPLFWAITARILAGTAQVVARVLFAFSYSLVWYGSQVKQYSSDVLIALALTLIALELPGRVRNGGWPLLALVVGPLACWFSTPAALVLAGLGVSLLTEAPPRDPVCRRKVLTVLVVWAAGAVVAGGVAMRAIAPETHNFMQSYWRHAMLPLPPWRLIDVAWPVERLGSIFAGSGLNYAWPGLQLALAVIGFTTCFRSHRGHALALLGPIAAALLAALLHLYPFAGRLLAFGMPALIIGLALGIARVAELVRSRTALPAVLVHGALLMPALGPMLLAPPVYRPEEVRPILAYLVSQRRPEDPVYVYHGAGWGVDFYGPVVGLVDSGVTRGGGHRDDRSAYLAELDQFRGRGRVWLVFSHDDNQERCLMLDYLDVIGRAADSLVVPGRIPVHPVHGAAVYRFDLSDPARLRQADARTFPLDWESKRAAECRL